VVEWSLGLLDKLWSVLGWVWSKGRFFLSSPELELVRGDSGFGYLSNGEFAVLLRFRFRNTSEKPVLLNSLQLRYAGTWHAPSTHPPLTVGLQREHGLLALGVPRELSVTESPRIPPLDVVQRFAFYRLPAPAEPWPKALEVTAKAVFARHKDQKITVRLE
jgi:hypothetical protein